LVVAASELRANAAQKFDVTILNRQMSEENYSYIVPGRVVEQSTSTADCSGVGNGVNCIGSTKTTGTVTPAHAVSYTVQGATFTLKLPDSRLVVVNCSSKYTFLDALFSVKERRSCRIPSGDHVQAEFDGDAAKLRWPVSIDG